MDIPKGLEGSITQLMNRISSNPDEMNNLIEKAKNMISGGNMNDIMKNLSSAGIDLSSMKNEFQGQMANIKAIERKNAKPLKVFVITTGRKLKHKEIDSNKLKDHICTIIGDKESVQLSCSRLAQGPLENRSIKFWYSNRPSNKNRRASKIIGMSIMGDVVIVVEGEDVSVAQFQAAEQMLS